MQLMRILTAIVAVGVVVAGVVLWGLTRRSGARWIVAALTAYGAIAFAQATLTGLLLREVLAGHGLFQVLPRMLQGAFIGAFVVLPLGWIAAVVRAGIPRLREGSPRRTIYQAVALTTCLGLVLTSVSYESRPRAGSPGSSQSAADRVKALENSLRAIEDGDRDSPRDRWDPDYVVKMVGRDFQQLFQWVRNNTFWIPYRGVLRGPVGVLMDRQGNNLDRALLLVTLLETAGHVVRLAHSELTREQAIELLPHLVADRAIAALPQTPVEGLDRDIQLAAARYQLDGTAVSNTLEARGRLLSRISSELRARVTDQTERLLRAVERPKAAAMWARTFESSTAALMDHWLVQCREGQNWVDLDLLDRSGNREVSTAPAGETTAVEDLPAEMHHAITVRVIAEQWAGGTLAEHKAVEHVLRPADLIGKSVVLQFWPTEWIESSKLGAPGRDWTAEVLAQKEWDAVLAIGGNVISIVTLPENGDDPNAPAKGGVMGGFAGAFANTMGLGAKNANRHLSAVWLEYEIHVPGDKPRILRRTVFDLIGPAGRATSSPTLALDDAKKLTRSLSLTMQTEILPIACGLAPEFVAHLLAQNLLTNRDLFGFLLQGKLPAGTSSLDQLFDRSEPSLSSLYLLALSRLELGNQEQIYIDRPNVFTRHLYSALSGRDLALREATDIVANEVGVSLAARDAFPIRLAQGVLDTNAESLLRTPAATFGNAGDAFAASRRWTAVASQDAAAVGKLNLADDVRRQIATELAGGYAIVAPEAPVKTPREPFSGWWRIDPATGDALGLGANGWGQVIAEESSHDARVARTAPAWKQGIKKFAVRWALASTAYYGWCVAPLVFNVAGDELTLGHSLGIWEGAIKPSVQDCGGDSIVIGGITAWLLPVGVAAGAGRSARRALTGPRPARGCSVESVPDEPLPPGEPVDPLGKTVRDTAKDSRVTDVDPGVPPPEPPGSIPPLSVEEATANEVAAKAAKTDALNQVEEASQKFVRYRPDNVPDWNEATWKDLEADANRKDSIFGRKSEELDNAERALRDARARARGAAGRGGLGCGWGSSPQAQVVVGSAAANNAIGGANPPPPGTPKL